MDILHKRDTIRGGFAGIRENAMVKTSAIFGHKSPKDKSFEGIGNFIYLSDANFIPNGETGMHPHRDLDVLSFMVKGNVLHEGTLEDGKILHESEVQIQRAGRQGFYHNEINPDNEENRMIQFWMLPNPIGQEAEYQKCSIANNELKKIYGGKDSVVFSSATTVEIGHFTKPFKFSKNVHEFIVYITKGTALINCIKVEDGDLIKGNQFEFENEIECQFILIHI